MNTYSKPVSILLIGPSYPFRGGISHYTTLLYKNLMKKHSVVFLSFKKQYPKFLFPGKTDRDKSQQPLKQDGTEHVLNPLNPLTFVDVLKKVKYYKPQLIIFQWWVIFWGPVFWIIAVISKVIIRTKVLFICHNVFEHEGSRIKRLLSKLFLSSGDYFIVHSEKDMRDLKDIIPHAFARKTFLPSFNVFNFNRLNQEKAKEELKLKGNVLLFFGFIRKYKGLDYLLKAMPKIIEGINATLLIVGEFWSDKKEYLDSIDELKIKDKIVVIDKYVPNEEMELYFKACDLVVLPYISGTGSAIAQLAMGFAKPLVVTNAGCLPEIINDGKTGYVVESMNPDAIADAVIKYFKGSKQKEFSENIKKESYRFSWDNIVSEIEKLLNYK